MEFYNINLKSLKDFINDELQAGKFSGGFRAELAGGNGERVTEFLTAKKIIIYQEQPQKEGEILTGIEITIFGISLKYPNLFGYEYAHNSPRHIVVEDRNMGSYSKIELSDHYWVEKFVYSLKTSMIENSF